MRNTSNTNSTSNMNNASSEKLSALMDGELGREDALTVIKMLGQNEAQRGDWDCYHLIGDALRGQVTQDSTQNAAHADEAITASLAAPIDAAIPRRRASTEAIFAQLAAEPTLFAPAAARDLALQAKSTQKSAVPQVHQRTRFALAMAASVVTVSAIGVIAFKQQQGIVASTTVAQQALVKQAQASGDSSVSETRVNDYLQIHRQFANPAALQAAALKRTERTERTERINQPALPFNEQPRTEQSRAVNQ